VRRREQGLLARTDGIAKPDARAHPARSGRRGSCGYFTNHNSTLLLCPDSANRNGCGTGGQPNSLYSRPTPMATTLWINGEGSGHYQPLPGGDLPHLQGAGTRSRRFVRRAACQSQRDFYRFGNSTAGASPPSTPVRYPADDRPEPPDAQTGSHRSRHENNSATILADLIGD